MRSVAPDVGVLVVDDHAHFRRTVRDLVDATPGFVALGEAASGEEALRKIASLEPDLVLMDVRMPGLDGIETARRITAERPHPTVILISMDDRRTLAQTADSCGAATFLCKRDVSTAVLRRLWAEHGSAA